MSPKLEVMNESHNNGFQLSLVGSLNSTHQVAELGREFDNFLIG